MSELVLAQVAGVDLSAEPARYVLDGLQPGVVATPSTQQDVAAVLAAAHESGAGVVPWGGGSHQALGRPPERYDLALDLTRLNRLVEHEPADLTVTVEAGMSLHDLQATLHQSGQWLAIDPVVDARATVGGLLATNVSGPARHSRGSWRDLLIGISFVTAEGALVKSGGRVVKNVAGYDLGKLQIGALGTLGVITQATFKVAPLPARSVIVEVEADFSNVMSITSLLRDSPLAIESLIVNAAAGGAASLLVTLSGGAAAVERSLRDLRSMAVVEPSQRLAPEVRERLETLHTAAVVARLSVSPADVSATCEALLAAGAGVSAYPGVGIVYGAWQTPPAAETLSSLRVRCESTGGALVIDRAPSELRGAVDPWGTPRGDFALMQRLKQEFDPKRVLNPGRFLGGI